MTAWQPIDPFAGMRQALMAASAPPVGMLDVADPLAGMGVLRRPSLVDRTFGTGIGAALFSGVASPSVASSLAAVLSGRKGWGPVASMQFAGQVNVGGLGAVAAGLPRLQGRSVADMIGGAASAGVLDTVLRETLTRNSRTMGAFVAGLPTARNAGDVLGVHGPAPGPGSSA